MIIRRVKFRSLRKVSKHSMKSRGVFEGSSVARKSTSPNRKLAVVSDDATRLDEGSPEAHRSIARNLSLREKTPDYTDPVEAAHLKMQIEEIRKEFDGGDAPWPKHDALLSKFYSETLLKILKYQRMRDFEERFIELMKSVAAEAIDGTLLDENMPEAIESLLRAHFHRAHELNKPPIPTIKYRPRVDKIIPFLYLIWSDWIASGHFTKAVLRQNDKPAYTALQNWLRTNEMPTVIAARNFREVNDEFVQREWFHRDEVVRATGALYRRAPEE